MNKVQKTLVSVCTIIFVILTVLYFAVPFPKNAASWIAYLSSVVAVVFSWCAANLAFRGTEELKSKVYGFPIFRIGYIYLIAQVIFTVAVCLINIIYPVAPWIAVIISVIFFGLALIGVIAADNAREAIERIDDDTTAQTKRVTYFKLDIAGVVDICRDDQLKRRLQTLADKFRYSDPVSSEELADIEDRISREIDLLRDLVQANNREAAEEKIDHITNLLADRNRRCKALKK